VVLVFGSWETTASKALFPETGFPRPFEYQYRTDEARNMDCGGADLGRFMLALETGDQFPSLLGLLQEDIFQIC
jgi:hypothetical protein